MTEVMIRREHEDPDCVASVHMAAAPAPVLDPEAEVDAFRRAIDQRWYRVTSLCRQAAEASRDYRDPGKVRRLLARAETQLAAIERMSGQDPSVIEIPDEDVTEVTV
jgi:hypothetical protein